MISIERTILNLEDGSMEAARELARKKEGKLSLMVNEPLLE